VIFEAKIKGKFSIGLAYFPLTFIIGLTSVKNYDKNKEHYYRY